MTEQLAKQFLASQEEQHAVQLIRQLRCSSQHHTGVLLGKFLSQRFPYSNQLLDEYAMNAYYAGDHILAYNIYTSLLAFKGLDQITSSRALHNRHFCVDKIKNRYATLLHPEIIKDIIRNKMRPRQSLPLITFTITTCKRLDLFIPTMTSFLNCCQDLDLISEWICVDDNSSQKDRDKMKELFPFFNFVWKDQTNKGHPQSLNILQNMVKTPYVLHMEDDWLFIEKRNYITDALEVMGDNDRMLQVLFNKNYAETAKDVQIKGGHFQTTNNGTRYYIHEWVTTEEDKKLWVEKHGNNGGHCNYWPHFSFRPSVFKRRVWQEFGTFNETVSHFEMEYSTRYAKAGYISGFFEGVYCLHTGRLTSEKDDKTKLNAYDLNGEAQFSGKEEQVAQKQEEKETEEPFHPFRTGRTSLPVIVERVDPIELEDFDRTMQTFVVNLERRPDRWDSFCKNNGDALSFLKYQRFDAIDGSKIKSTEQLQDIFENNDYNMRRGMVGCALSHIQLYINMINDEKSDIYCILEDDIELTPDFAAKMLHCYNQLRDSDWDMLYLGHHVYKKYITKETYNNGKMPRVEKWNRHRSLTESIGGTGGYLITRKGAEKLLNFIDSTGMTNGIDTVQQKSADILNIYYPISHLIYSECWRGDNNPDTDIQNDYTSLTIKPDIRLSNIISEVYGGVLETVTTEEEAMKRCFSITKPFCYHNDKGVESVKQLCPYSCYSIANKYLIVETNNEKHHRFKRNGKWTIKNALEY